MSPIPDISRPGTDLWTSRAGDGRGPVRDCATPPVFAADVKLIEQVLFDVQEVRVGASARVGQIDL